MSLQALSSKRIIDKDKGGKRVKDLDFDELDKAVNSLMATAPKDSPATDAQTERKTAALPDSSQDSPTPSEAIPTSASPLAPEKSPDISKPASQPAIIKRGGRFMDVVHPSSDMRTSSVAAPPRSGLKLSPISQSVEPEAPKAKQFEPTATKTARPAEPLPVTPPIETAPEPEKTVWPDPIDVHEKSNNLASQDTPPPDTPSAKTPSTPVASDTAPSAAPLSSPSPFLSDTKVEKRPLGGGASSAATQPSETPLSGDEPEDSKEKNEQVSSPSLPAELSDDVLSIESDKVDRAQSAPEITPVKVETLQPTGQSSISQQYKTQPSTGDQDHAAIYDSAADAPVLAHPVKKKSGWLVVALIILLIVLGAGIAAALYFSGIL